MNKALAVVYLHGLGSSPGSPKATLLARHFAAKGTRTIIPALALPTLQHLSVEAALNRVEETIEEAARDAVVVVVGSSFGGFLALHALGRLSEPAGRSLVGLALLAPVIYPFHSEEPVVSPATEEMWRRSGVLLVEEGASGARVPVHYQFLEELKRCAQKKPRAAVPTLVVHGVRDETVPYRHSVEFVAQTPTAYLVSLDVDHQMMSEPQRLVSVVGEFVQGCA
jgi:pimeloyl-ACP methyl ester carboxylesterase